jgi:hypothetical protein
MWSPWTPAQFMASLHRPSEFNVGIGFATDARVSGFDLTVLRDNHGFFPSYILAPVVRKATLDRVSGIKAPLEKLSAQLDNDSMAPLNAAVDLHGRRVEEVGSEFLLRVPRFFFRPEGEPPGLIRQPVHPLPGQTPGESSTPGPCEDGSHCSAGAKSRSCSSRRPGTRTNVH